MKVICVFKLFMACISQCLSQLSCWWRWHPAGKSKNVHEAFKPEAKLLTLETEVRSEVLLISAEARCRNALRGGLETDVPGPAPDTWVLVICHVVVGCIYYLLSVARFNYLLLSVRLTLSRWLQGGVWPWTHWSAHDQANKVWSRRCPVLHQNHRRLGRYGALSLLL